MAVIDLQLRDLKIQGSSSSKNYELIPFFLMHEFIMY